MIELNLTYEESKKILELGYDFSPVCPFYRVVKGRSMSLFNGVEFIFNLGLIERLESEVLAELERKEIHPNLGKSYRKSLVEKNIFDEIIPIIPKAALEDCLPDYSFTDAANRKLSCRWYGHIPICNEAYALNNIHLHHKSAYEAFMWCHEHYPEELKAKFDEVMA